MKILFIINDNEASHNFLPLGTAYVAGYIIKHGYKDVTYYSQDVYHFSENDLTEYLSTNKFDIVGIGFVAGYHQHRKILAICDAINKAKHRPFVVLGGHGPTPVPEFYMRLTKADVVVLGEGEVPFLNLVRAVEEKKSLKDVKGVAYWDGDDIVINEREKPITDIGSIPYPYIEPLPMEYYVNGKFLDIGRTDRVMWIVTSRGCYYSCNFCMRLEKGLRFRPIEDIIGEIKKYIRDYRISYFVFWDDCFIANEERIIEFADAILRENIKIRYWCAGRLNIVNEKILKLLKRSGCSYVDYGIEQFDDKALKAMNKRLTEAEIIRGIEMTLRENLLVGFNIIFGNLGDTRETFAKSVDLLTKYNNYGQLRTLRPVTPYPGTPLYFKAIEMGLLKGPADFYVKHVNMDYMTVNFTSIPDDEFYQILLDANTKIITDYFAFKRTKEIEALKKVYIDKDFSFRGSRHT
jgi:radical SAM superfamily enzyme YgiQ (UPF0313 family)